MVRNRAAVVGLIALGILLTLAQVKLPEAAAQVQPTKPPSIASTAPNGYVSVIWREFRPGERQTGPGTTVRVCAAALQREPTRSTLIVRFCEAQPMTPQRRFALGFDDLVVKSQLPGDVTLAYDLLNYVPTRFGATAFSQSTLPTNNAPLAAVKVENVTDVIFIINRELPLGLPTIEVTGRYADADLRDVVVFASLGANLEQIELGRVSAAPDWARLRY